MNAVSIRRPIITGLYVPGDRPDRFDKAVATGAQLIILDLEDAVSADRKELARDAVATWLSGRDGNQDGPVIQVRINAGSSLDLAVLAGVRADFEVRVPNVETLDDLEVVVSAVPGRPLTALIETARGVENATIIALHTAVTRLALGESDLSSDLGTTSDEAMDYARVRVLFAVRAAGKPAPMLSAFPNIRDLDGLRSDTERGRDLGWIGRTAIHPSQLDVIAEAFRPSAAQVDWALQVLAATARGGVSTLTSGAMVDGAMIGRARSVLEFADIRPMPVGRRKPKP